MIVVMADDLTGAAEIAGIGCQYGMTTEVQTEFFPNTDAGLLVIDTHSRSCQSLQAARRIKEITRQIKASQLNIDWIYKKTDSVLRGPIVAELNALLDVLDVKRALLVPGNPSKGRVVRQGRYFINGTPLNETDFANDPEHPSTSSNVAELLGLSLSSAINLATSDKALSCEGVFVGDADICDDLLDWTTYLDDQTIPAGAADFFKAILQVKECKNNSFSKERTKPLQYPALFIFGSGSDYSRNTLRKARMLGRPVCAMPAELLKENPLSETLLRQWVDEIIRTFENEDCVFVAIDLPLSANPSFARKLTSLMVSMVQQVLADILIGEIYIEGGATASEIVRCLGWKRFCPCDQLGPGVVRMHVIEKGNHYLTIKPGSYPWPETVWNLIMKGRSYAE